MYYAKWVIYFLILMLYFWEPVKNNELVSLISNGKNDYCITNSTSAMYFNSGHNKGETEGLQEQNLTDKVSSFVTLLKLEEMQDFRIPISFMGQEAHLLLCDQNNLHVANCYWFKIHRLNKVYVELRKCKTGEVTRKNCTLEKELPAKLPYTNDEKWNHLIIEKKSKNLSLQFHEEGNDTTINYFERDPKMFELNYLIGHREESNIYYKVHENRYMRSQNASEIIVENPFRQEELCISIFLNTCSDCQTIVIFMNENKNMDLWTQSIPPTNGAWVEHKIFMLKKTTEVFIYVKLKTYVGSGPTGGEFWSFDNFRQCHREEYRITQKTIGRKITECGLIANGRGVIKYEKDNNCSSTGRGNSKIRCKLLENQFSECGDIKIYEEINVPSQVKDLHMESSTAHSLKLFWRSPDCPFVKVGQYKVEYEKIERIACKTKTKNPQKSIETFTEHNSIELKNLEPYSEYRVTVYALNGPHIGKGLVEYYQTKELDYFDDSEGLEQIIITNKTLERSAYLTFSHIKCEKLHGPLKFKVKFRCISEWCLQTEERNETSTFLIGTLYLGTLQPFCKYKSEIYFCRHEECKVQEKKMFETKPSVPDKLKEIVVIPNGDGFIWIRWLPPYPPTGEISSYKIKISAPRIISGTYERKPEKCLLWPEYHCYIIEGKQIYDRNITVVIEAEIRGLDGYFNIGEQEGILVKEGPSEKPNNLMAIWKRNNTMELFWNHPNKTNGILQYFSIKLNSGTEYKFIANYTPKSWNLTYNYTIENIPQAVDLNIEIIAVNNKFQGAPAVLVDSSYPPSPELENSTILVTNHTKKTLSIALSTNQTEASDSNVEKYVLIIIDDQASKTKDQNLEKLEKILNTTLESRSGLRIVAALDVTKIPSNILNFTIGNGNVMKNNSILQVDIINEPLKEAEYGVVVIMLNKYKTKYRYSIYNITTSTVGDPKMTPFPTISEKKSGEENSSGGNALYALLLLLLLIPITIGILMKWRNKFFDKSTMSMENILDNAFESSSAIQNDDESFPISENIEMVDSPDMRKNTKLLIEKSTNSPNCSSDLYSRPVTLADLEEYVKTSIKNGELERQHALFLRDSPRPSEYGSNKINKSKNRYKNLVAFDHSRVILEKINEDEYSDYINANYIHGYNMQGAYIATQGPKSNTLLDFWRMIWQENVKYIIMLANIYEDRKKKVEKYWPNINEMFTFQDISVQLEAIELFSHYECRNLHVTKAGETRKIEQLHFTSWPDNGVPLYTDSLTAFLRKVLKIPLSSSSPVVVHCSAGVGRTGTILLADITLRMAAGKGVVNILSNLRNLRDQRANMVDNIEQYKLAHLIVLECLMGPRTSIPCNDLNRKVEKLIRNGQYKVQMNFLKDSEWQDQAMRTIAVDDKLLTNYPEKNRIQEIIPEHHGRIILSKYPEEDETSSYINAVYVDGFRCPGRFFVTQQPMPNTLGDFWRLVTEKKVKVILSLNAVDLQNTTCCKFWPTVDDPELRPIDYLVVKFVDVMELECYDQFSLNVWIRNKVQTEKLEVVLVAFKSWPSNAMLHNCCEELLSFYEEAYTISRGFSNILVTCFDGVTASGVYVAMSFIIEQMKLEHECDVCLAVRTIRHNRKQFITDENQFLFLYECAVKFMNGFKIENSR
ncbi:receptor-type tyrosine-protein phosphatase mu-like isoform X2 [Harmonia axyridis]|uniref:receptor-type tyrosine-protein phosphatase mu-like isoform X2 n=1 Tax=Harmonia axyridis TaxID=115357 RepID=UPI001E2752CD|nr:receptor-type tyrosine-protein phosphatase mu-like isoform X2 [Harmonia axyridis]